MPIEKDALKSRGDYRRELERDKDTGKAAAQQRTGGTSLSALLPAPKNVNSQTNAPPPAKRYKSGSHDGDDDADEDGDEEHDDDGYRQRLEALRRDVHSSGGGGASSSSSSSFSSSGPSSKKAEILKARPAIAAFLKDDAFEDEGPSVGPSKPAEPEFEAYPEPEPYPEVYHQPT